MNDYVTAMVAFAGLLVSLFFSYVPGLRVKFAALEEGTQQLTMLLIVLALGLISVLVSCIPIGGTPLWPLIADCSRPALIQFGWAVFFAGTANQVTYKYSPKTADTKQARALRDADNFPEAG